MAAQNTNSWRAAAARLKHLTKLVILSVLKASGVFALARAKHSKHPRILCYHGAWLGSDGFRGDSMFITASTFERRLDLLFKHSFSVIPLDHAVEGLAGKVPLPADSVVITIDDGWYSTYAKMLPALKLRGLPATIYCDTGNLLAGGPVPHVAARYLHAIHPASMRAAEVDEAFERTTFPGLDREAKLRGLQQLLKLSSVDFTPYEKARVFHYMTAEELRQASDDGFDVELHTHTHDLHGFDPRLVEQEIETNRAILSRLTGRPAESFRHFCYPSGRYAASARPVLQRLGILSATVLDSRLAMPSDDPLFLPRILDGEHMTELEFEAALYGVPDLLRGWVRAIRRRLSGVVSLKVAKHVYRATTAR
jgi:peptidoglycan/xylan/chitin deacetylase (PgdA/CDA1 family)